MPMTSLDREGLQTFIRSGDKSPPPVFVGRETVLGKIEENGLQAWKGDAPIHGEPGLTSIIHGAPGAGKSSILFELMRRAEERDEAPGQSRVLCLGSGRINGTEDILRPLAMLVNSERAPDFLARVSQVRTRRIGASLKVVGGGIERQATMTSPAPGPDWTAFNDWVASWSGDKGLPAPVIIAVDEAQRFKHDDMHPVAKLLQAIHDGNAEQPVTLVLAGLGDTVQRAIDMGLTRGTTLHPVGGLGPEDVAELMRRFCRHFGVAPDGHEAELETLAAPTEGWPRHLHFAMQALGRAMLAVDGDLARVDWDAVMADAAESRVRYYVYQQSEIMKDSKGLVAAAMKMVPGAQDSAGADRGVILQAIRDNVRDDFIHALPEGMNERDLFKHLIHQGALQERGDDTFHCPIPSFRHYLVQAGESKGCRNGKG